MRSLIMACAIGSMALAACARPYETAPGTAARPASGGPPTEMVARQNDAYSATKNDVSSSADRKEFLARVLGDTEDVWSAIFKSTGNPYPMPTLVLFSGQTSSACGVVSSTAGPVYCPADRRIYIDPDLLSVPSQRQAVLVDFAQAYLLAREVGHHVQNTLGTMAQFEHALSQTDEPRRIQLQVRLELQADCYAGVWAFYVQRRHQLDPGDLEQGVPAAQTVGDVSTHGTSAQRMWWFNQGLATGDPRECDTFSHLQP